jgi:hypothetical protein
MSELAGQAAQAGAGDEQDQREDPDTLGAEAVDGPAADRDDDGQGEQVAGGHPLDGGDRHMEVAAEGGECDGDDRRIEDRHDGAEDDDCRRAAELGGEDYFLLASGQRMLLLQAGSLAC